ncbi:hypothetical protein BH23DEI1_BH23DEI1_20260 [soil metagenome]|nr:succinylglutamate desuccinylase/aspartoacylase family protein [Trueperaceae bacterium]
MTPLNDTIRSALTWSTTALPGDPSAGSVALRHAEVVGPTDGPTVTITCGVHGDEGPWGALAVQRVLERPLVELRGRLRLVFAANPTSVAADTRGSPLDHLDLNRCFPGAESGSHSERLAAVLARIVAGSDVLIDLHGGGSWCVNAFAFRFPGSEDLANAVGAPFVVDMAIRTGNLAGHVSAAGTRVVAIEMGGRSVDELLWRDRLGDGVERVLGVAESLPRRLSEPEPSTPVTDLSVVRPSIGGVLVPAVRQDAIGTVVPKDTLLGVVHDLHTMEPSESLTAPFDRTALLLIRPHVAVLEGGAMTYVVGRPG